MQRPSRIVSLVHPVTGEEMATAPAEQVITRSVPEAMVLDSALAVAVVALNERIAALTLVEDSRKAIAGTEMALAVLAGLQGDLATFLAANAEEARAFALRNGMTVVEGEPA